MAVAASLLTTVYHMIREGTPYKDLGANHFTHDRDRTARRVIHRGAAFPKRVNHCNGAIRTVVHRGRAIPQRINVRYRPPSTIVHRRRSLPERIDRRDLLTRRVVDARRAIPQRIN